jgi:hypothetical protein
MLETSHDSMRAYEFLYCDPAVPYDTATESYTDPETGERFLVPDGQTPRWILWKLQNGMQI